MTKVGETYTYNYTLYKLTISTQTIFNLLFFPEVQKKKVFPQFKISS